jgi:hypothetical protein
MNTTMTPPRFSPRDAKERIQIGKLYRRPGYPKVQFYALRYSDDPGSNNPIKFRNLHTGQEVWVPLYQIAQLQECK